MYTVSRIKEPLELMKVWPRLYRLAKIEDVGLESSQHLQLLLRCFGLGAVFVVRNDGSVCGACFVELTPSLTLVLHGIPNDKGTGISKVCLEAVKEFARENQVRMMQATTRRLSGSSYRFFEKVLGFRRHSVTFKLKV